MSLVDGDLIQLAEIKKLTVEQYLIVLEKKILDSKKDNGTR